MKRKRKEKEGGKRMDGEEEVEDEERICNVTLTVVAIM